MKENIEKAKAMAAQLKRLKTKEGRLEAIAKARDAMFVAKDKTVALWKSGPKGKAIIGTIIFIALWIMWPSNKSDSVVPPAITNGVNGDCQTAGLRKLRDTDMQWYESDETYEIDSHCSYKVVKPNLYKLPPFIKSAFLETAIFPSFEKEKGDAFGLGIGGIEAISIGKGYVVAGRYDSYNEKMLYAYIITDDDYADGQALKQGFYAYVGLQSVEMTDGSSKRMPAFKKLDNVYVEAVEYNNKAEAAAEEENDRRKNSAIADKDTAQCEKVVAAIQADAKNLDGRDDSKFIHIPNKFAKAITIVRIPYWKWIDNSAISELERFVRQEDFITRMNKGDRPYYLANLDRNDTIEKMREQIKDYYLRYRFEVNVITDAQVTVYTIHPRNGVKIFNPEYDGESLFDEETHICVVDNDFAVNHDGSIMNFMEAYEEKYGK